MNTLPQQLYDAGLAPEEVRLLNDRLPGGYVYSTPIGIDQFGGTEYLHWRPDTDWNHAMYYVERDTLTLEPHNGRWYVLTSPRTAWECAATFAEVPAAICRLVLRIGKEE